MLPLEKENWRPVMAPVPPLHVAAADLAVGKEELRFLAMLRDALGLDKLVTAALERSESGTE